MILKIDGYKNCYQFTDTSCTEDLKQIREQYEPTGVRCIICNRTTSKHFKLGLFTPRILTINNKVPDGYFYLNGKY